MFYRDRQKFDLTSGFFIFLFMMTDKEIIFICSTENICVSQNRHYTKLPLAVCAKVFLKYWRNLQEHTHTEIQLQIIGCNLANMPKDIWPKKCTRKLCIWHPGCHMYAFCMSISNLLSSGIKLGVRKFRDLINFGLYCSLSASSVLLYFRAWVENHLKNCIKSLMVAIPSYFYKDNKYKTLKSSMKKAIWVTL